MGGQRVGLGLAAILTVLLSGCTPAVNGGGTAAPPPASDVTPGIIIATGHGWTSAGLEGRMPAPGTCHARQAADGEPLPDPACTPGAIDTAVTDTNIDTTVCRKGGYTSTVRPPVSLTEPAKRKLLAAYGIPASRIRDYELDHLVDLAAGGASDVRNLWPEPNTFTLFHPGTAVHNDKDVVESYTFHAICQHKVTASAVERAMATDWSTAVARLGLPPIPADYQS
ncbi:hypothetical protein HC031_15800 [Planosporangium thailandense]|uniref:HNH endonuclease n=1 Tax=Planosporangium thailandense TaxID=765197 RepID=A0ABX0Y1D0_9ACTN|nr:hypothetical protein [Planosporangium thailandense]NJC71164.1 hypothetical protein [Planosporangium thailandense]